MKTFIKAYFIFLFLLLYSFPFFSQSYQFKNFGADNGITQPNVYAINQDRNGYLWVGTGEGVCKFDGISFKSFYTIDGVSENFVTTSYRDRSNNLWLGHKHGGITFFDGKTFKAIYTEGVSKSPVTCIVGDEKDNIWCATQNDGIFRISNDSVADVFKDEFKEITILSIHFSKGNQLLVGTDLGLMVYDLKGEKRKPQFLNFVSSVPKTRVQCIIKKNNSGSFWIGTENKGVYLLNPNLDSPEHFSSSVVAKNIDIDFSNIQDIYEDTEANLWIATFGNGVIKLLVSANTLEYDDYQHFSDDNGLGTKFTKTIYSDHEGNIWVGTSGIGLVELTGNCFSFYSHTTPKFSNSVTSILIGKKTNWFGIENGLIKMDVSPKEKWTFYSEKNGFVDDLVTSLFQTDSNHLIIGTDKNGAFQLDISKNVFSKINLYPDLLSNSINSITGYNKIIWFATKNGLFKVELEKKIKTHYTTESGLVDNNINKIYLDSDNNLWIATHSNFISYIDKNGTIENKKIYYGRDKINITGLIKDKNGVLWVATFGNGVYKITKNSISRFSTFNGLKSNYCYSIVNDTSNNIWVGHRMGLSCIRTLKNSVNQYDKADGIQGYCNYNAFFKDYYGNIWFGTSNGAVKYDPRKDKINQVPPILNITSVKLDDSEIDLSKKITLPYGNYRLRIEFIGISYKSGTHINYQYKLDGYDVGWSDKSNSNFAYYGKLSDGEYSFLVKAFNNDGVSNTVPLMLKISIAPPIWKRWWFIVLVVAALFYGFFVFVKVRERNHRKFEMKLKKMLNEKTREVISQKEEIEKKNKDITDSIRYAKRIQDAILPDWEKVRKIFPESFVFVQPRDIVSGDFYWFEKHGNKLIIACADSTGHGVPGAFMSIIGNTLLKDISSRPEVTSPAHVLQTLDNEIKVLLRQNDDDYERTYDSVDVIFCEIDIETLFIRICSTRRPVIVSINNELTMFKKEYSEIDNYETHDIQLKKGDTIYMFTDGYPDQFGGTHGKKIKMSNIKIMLEQMQTLPIAEQAMIIDRYFNRWKEGHDQVDDVLFIGIRL